MKLETERLLLRRFTTEDVKEAYNYLGDPDTMRYIEAPYSEEQTKEFIRNYAACDAAAVYALVEKKSGHLIGHMIFHPYGCEQIYELGFIIHREYQKQGYGFEMSHALLRYGFQKMKLHKITAETVEPNEASRHLLQKLGMKQEAVFREQVFYRGEWMDEYHYGILAKDYYADNSVSVE